MLHKYFGPLRPKEKQKLKYIALIFGLLVCIISFVVSCTITSQSIKEEQYQVVDPCTHNSITCNNMNEGTPINFEIDEKTPSVNTVYAELGGNGVVQDSDRVGVFIDPVAVKDGEASTTVYQEIVRQAQEYGINVEKALDIASCESNFNPYASNPESTAKGVYQFTDPTWEYIKAVGHQYDYKENVKQFMIWYRVHPEWWEQCN